MKTKTKHERKHRPATAAKRGRGTPRARRDEPVRATAAPKAERSSRRGSATAAWADVAPKASAAADVREREVEAVRPNGRGVSTGVGRAMEGEGVNATVEPIGGGEDFEVVGLDDAAVTAVGAEFPTAGEPVEELAAETIAGELTDEPELEVSSAGDGEDEPAAVEMSDADEPEAGDAAPGPARRKADEEPQSFLAMYFRDMAELDVLRPEQEFETARNIETLEIDLWKVVLGHPASFGVLADAVDVAVNAAGGKPIAELAALRALADKAKGKASGSARAKFEKAVADLAPTLRELDIDRLYIEAAVGEIARLDRSARAHAHDAPAYATTKSFQDFARTTAGRSRQVKAAKNAFVKANLRLVVSIARRFNHGRLPLADLIQEGNIGLMKAVERYDYRRGFRFSTYASWWIRHAISRALADKGRAVRLPVHMIDAYHRIAKSERELQSKLERPATDEEIASAAGIETDKLEKMRTFLNETPVSLDRPISDDDGRRLIDVLADPQDTPSPPEQMVTSETHREMLKLLSSLKPIEADILRKRFGLLNDKEQTLKEIGDEYRLSRERVRQLQEQALGKMRKAMSKLESA